MIASYYAEQIKQIEEKGVVVMRDVTGFASYGKDTIWPYLTLALCHSGSSRALYDMQEIIHKPHYVACIMPGHIHRPLDSSDDFSATFFILSHQLYSELPFRAFSHDSNKFNATPVCHLTPEQAQQMVRLTDQLEIIANHTEEELPHRKEMLFAILCTGFEFLNLYWRGQDKQYKTSHHAKLFHRFCELVVAHYKESREVQFYADLLHLTPKHFTKVIRQEAKGLSPAEWIEQYVCLQAKRLIETQSGLTLQEISYKLGFSEPTSFHRYFKRVTGLTARQYKDTLAATESIW